MVVFAAGFEMALSPFCAAALAAVNATAMQSKRAIFMLRASKGVSRRG
jgi:hypothetical protein